MPKTNSNMERLSTESIAFCAANTSREHTPNLSLATPDMSIPLHGSRRILSDLRWATPQRQTHSELPLRKAELHFDDPLRLPQTSQKVKYLGGVFWSITRSTTSEERRSRHCSPVYRPAHLPPMSQKALADETVSPAAQKRPTPLSEPPQNVSKPLEKRAVSFETTSFSLQNRSKKCLI